MKRHLIIEGNEHDLELAVAILRDQGLNTIDYVGEAPKNSGVDNEADAVMIIHPEDGTILEANRRLSDLSGFEMDSLLGKSFLSITFFLNPLAWSRALKNLEHSGEPVEFDSRVLKKDGLVAFVHVSISKIDYNGSQCHVMTIRENPLKGVEESAFPPVATSADGLEPSILGEVDADREEIGRLIDFQALQDLMNSFYKVTRIGIGINDVKGNVHVATGWQEICTRFHRVHPETLEKCLESDIHLSQNTGSGKYTLYKCKNNMWDISTPIIIGGRHIANIFLGQFFFEDEMPDYEFFREQARRYGFDSKEYLAALDAVPRWSRETVMNVMEFYSKLAMLISRLSIGNIRLTQSLAEQKRVSEELRMANLIVENSPVVLFRWRAAEGWPVELVSENIVQFGYTSEELLSGSVSFSSMVHPDDLERVTSEVRDYSIAGIDGFKQEYRIVHKSGETRWVYDRTVIVRDVKGEITHFQGIVIDITEQKRNEERISSALAEKEVLLKEVHHRVKNNMQIITSLLDLQSEYIKSKESRMAIEESKSRIRSMALVHEQLYRSRDLSHIDFSSYVDELVNTIGLSPEVVKRRVEIRTEVAEVEMDMEKAIPCGLIINELVLNALKHAFPNDRHGVIAVTCHRNDEGGITMKVSDNGVGLPAGLDFRSTDTMGLSIVNLLVRQLRGSIELAGGGGTAYIIRFRAEIKD